MKIKVDAEKLIAKYLLGDLTDPEKEQLDNWIKSSLPKYKYQTILLWEMQFSQEFLKLH